jgi:hypothetical protein
MQTQAPITIEQADWQRFLTSDGLAEKAGCPKQMFQYMVIKEFADNAADLGDYTGQLDYEKKRIEISNGGNGLTSEEVSKLFSIKRPLRSSKHWRRGERGALGNGIRAALAGCRVLNVKLEVISRGQIYTINLLDNGDTDITRETVEDDFKGTKLVLTFPENIEVDSSVRKFLEPQFKTQEIKVVQGKPMPSWFETEDFNVLMQSMPANKSVADVVSQFNVELAGANIPLNDQINEVSAEELHSQLIEIERPTEINGPPKDLYEGKHYRYEGFHGHGKARIPYIVDVWSTSQEAGRNQGYHDLDIIMNGTAMLGKASLEVKSGRVRFISGGYYYSGNTYKQLNMQREWRVKMSINSPFVPISSSGKQPDFGQLRKGIMESLYSSMRASQKLPPKPKKHGMTVKSAAFMVMEEAYNKVSDDGKYWANARQLMYAARPAILKYAKQSSFTDSWFTQTILPEFLQQNPELTQTWRIAYDKRGDLIQPHNRATVGLGTVEVDSFGRHDRFISNSPVSSFAYTSASPERRFGGILFVEKEGFNQALLESGILERYDLALASSKGQPNIAIRALIDEMLSRNPNFKIFTVTDFDISGVSIRDVLLGDNKLRFEYRNKVKPIRICVDWTQASRLHDESLSEFSGLKSKKEDEDDNLYYKLISRHGLEHEAARFLAFDKLRVEVNALTTPELINTIEKTVSQHCKKVLPDREHLEGAWRQYMVSAELNQQQKQLQTKYADARPPYGIMDKIKEYLELHPECSWDEALSKLLEN